MARTTAFSAPLLGAMALTATFGSYAAHAKGGASISVTTTATVNGTVVTGTITIDNTGSSPATVAAVTDWLEVRYPTGYPPPAYPTGSTTDSFRVGDVAVPLPAAIPAHASVTIAYSVNVCGGVAAYGGARDMRNVVIVTVGGAAIDARSDAFAPPSLSACPVCGNGRIEAGEQCDGGSCCTPACAIRADGTTCNDGNACTQTDRCTAGVCIGSDPVVCAASDQCHAAGACSPVGGTCSNPVRPTGTMCDDANACTTGDRCMAGQCAGVPLVCNDGNVCTDDVCVGGLCAHTNNTAACDDGDVCTDNDRCGDGACGGGGPLDCDDHQTCTDDACVSAVGCVHPDTASCDVCDASECAICQDVCTGDRNACEAGCWQHFFSCLDGCTLTYCAAFCQADLGQCISACPDEATCKNACELGNACAAGCTPVP